MNKDSVHLLRVSESPVISDFVSQVFAKAGTDCVFTLANRATDYREIVRAVSASTNKEAKEISSIMGFDNLSYLSKFLTSSLAEEIHVEKYGNYFDITRGTPEGAYQTVYSKSNYERNVFGFNLSTNVPLTFSFPDCVEEAPLLREYTSSFKGIAQGQDLGVYSFPGFRKRLYKLSIGASAVLSARLVTRYDFNASLVYDKAVKNYLVLVNKLSSVIEESADPEELKDYDSERKQDIYACYASIALTAIAMDFVTWFGLFDESTDDIRDHDNLEDMTFKSLRNLFLKDAKTSHDIISKDIIYDENAFVMYLFGLEGEIRQCLEDAVVESLKSIDESVWKAVQKLSKHFLLTICEQGITKHE